MTKAKEPAKETSTELAPSQRMRPPARRAPSPLEMLAEAARDPAVDAAKVRELRAIQKEIQRDEDEREFARDYNRMIPKLPMVDKDGMIVIEPKPGKRGQKTAYASLNNIKKLVWPILAACRFGFEWESKVIPAGEHGALQHVMTGMLRHDNGCTRVSEWPIMPETTGSKNDAQARGSGSTYARRYTLTDLVPFISFAKEDRDDDAAAVSPMEEGDVIISKEQLKGLRKAIKDCGVAPAAFEQHYGPPEKLPLARLDEALSRCRQFAERNKGNADAA